MLYVCIFTQTERSFRNRTDLNIFVSVWNITAKTAGYDNIYSMLAKEHNNQRKLVAIYNSINEATEELVNIYYKQR